MQRQRGDLVPIGEALADLPGPVQALIPSRSTQHHFTLPSDTPAPQARDLSPSNCACRDL